MRKWLSRQAHNLKVVGSNPTPALCLLSYKRLYLDLKKSETPESFQLRQVTPFATICTRDSGRRGPSQDNGGIVQLVEQWNHNP